MVDQPAPPVMPTGTVLWATSPKGFGFATDVHVAHFDNLSAFSLELTWNGQPLSPSRSIAYASRLEVSASVPGLDVVERKLITADDVLISSVIVTAGAAGSLVATVASALADRTDATGRRVGAGVHHALPLHFDLGVLGAKLAGSSLVARRNVEAGDVFEVRVALAAARSPEVAAAAVDRVLADADPAATEAAYLRRWLLDLAPGFDAPDEMFTRAFLYRLLVAKKAILDPRHGYLQHPAAVEGRWAARWYPVVITYGAGHQLNELRWLRDPELAWGHLSNFVDNQRDDGAFVGASIDLRLREYTDFIAASAYDLFLASGDRSRFATVGRALARNVDYMLTRDCDGDFMPVPANHWETGMEWQPSFFAPSGYDTTREAVVERVDYACYLYGGAVAAARALELAGEDGDRYREVAERTRASIEGVMWDAVAGTYLSQLPGPSRRITALSHEIIDEREIVGFYPPGFGVTPDEKLLYLRLLSDPVHWRAPWPVPSVDMRSPAFHPGVAWPLGPGGSSAMWNGATWPHAQSFVLRSLARAERAGAVAAGASFALLRSYTEAHFAGVDHARRLDWPVVGEMYNAFRGQWLTNERDYFHSTYVDLVITLLGGILPAEDDRLRISPLPAAGLWDRYAITRIPYHGHEIAIAWDAPGGADAYGDGVEGLAVWVDGTLRAIRPESGPLEIDLDLPR